MNPNIFVTTLPSNRAEELKQGLEAQGFVFSHPAYTLFSAKKKGISCTLYESGKLVVQGKEMREFIEFYLEPQILHSFEFTHPLIDIDLTGRIGIDESGKGDFFGPLCVGGLFAVGEEIKQLHEIGVKDCKMLNDKSILLLAKKIAAKHTYYIVNITPPKYNQLYSQFGNLNRLLAWAHATAIEQLVTKTQCKEVVIDQFANESVVLEAVRRKNLELNLKQRHRAEEDIVVAAASIMARAAFLKSLEALSQEFAIELPKGASAKIIEIGKMFVKKYGKEQLHRVAKLHFKTTDAIVPFRDRI